MADKYKIYLTEYKKIVKDWCLCPSYNGTNTGREIYGWIKKEDKKLKHKILKTKRR